jgi:hypothetical protein|tara:strand:+ start:364 stop:678 length:315 start_codon:yes stop_codon:yes gene_type:complete
MSEGLRQLYKALDTIGKMHTSSVGAGNMEVLTSCPMCGGLETVVVNIDGFQAWKGGALIQDALPELDRDTRELLITGMHSECWDAMFAEQGDVNEAELMDDRPL